MGTTIRPELSSDSKYYIPKHRYYELKHFCLQSPDWKQALYSTSLCPEEMLIFNSYTSMIEKTAMETDSLFGKYILLAVTKGLAYPYLRTKLNMPCGKDQYYKFYHKFFYLLSKERK